MGVEVWLTEPYYREFHKRKNVQFGQAEAVEVYMLTQLLQANWPSCATNASIAPEVGMKSGIYYVKFNWQFCNLRIAFGAHRDNGVDKIVALTCRSKQELSKGNSNGDREWYKHLATEGVDTWDDYQRNLVPCWKIY